MRETRHHVAVETKKHAAVESAIAGLSRREVFELTTWKNRNLSAVTQAGLVNNLNDGMAWGLFPLLFASAGLDLLRIGWLVALSSSFAGFAAGATLLGLGTAMVYPTLLAAIGDVAHPRWRASVAGVDARGRGYVVGAMNGRHQLHVWTAMTARVPWPPSRRASVSVPAW